MYNVYHVVSIDRKAECGACVPDCMDGVVGGIIGPLREALLGLLPFCFPLMVISSARMSQVSPLVCPMPFVSVQA